MGESVDEIVVIPSTFFDAVSDWDFWHISGLQDVSCDACEKCGVGWRVVLSGAAEILVEMDVKYPVEAIFDLPVRSRDVERLLRSEEAGGHEQARQRLGLVALSGDANKGGMPRHERLVGGNHIGMSPLVAAVAEAALCGACQRGGLSEQLLCPTVPMAAVSLQSQHIAGAAVDQRLGHAAMTMQCIDCDDFASQINQFDN